MQDVIFKHFITERILGFSLMSKEQHLEVQEVIVHILQTFTEPFGTSAVKRRVTVYFGEKY